MKKFILFFSLFIFSCSEETIFFENSYVIENINIIDPIDGLSSNKTLVITKNKITEIFNSNEIKVSKKNKIFNGEAKFLIPGLWDAHGVPRGFSWRVLKGLFDLLGEAWGEE